MSVKKKTRKPRIILAAIFAAILCCTLIKITTQIPDYAVEQDSVEKAEEVARGGKEDDVSQVEPEDIPAPADPDLEYLSSLNIEKLQAENPDVSGWILIPGTDISYPLLKGENNEYYLKHTWDNQKNACGSIFYDYRSSPGDWNAVIYGHNMRNGSMFANLHKYKKEDFAKDNNRLLILHDGGVSEYRFASAFEAKMDGVPYLFGDASRTEKNQFREEISEKAGVDFGENTSFITLSTCTGLGHKTRWVVVFSADNKQPYASAVYLNKTEGS